MVLYVPTWEVSEDGNVGLHPIMSANLFQVAIYLQCLLQDANSPSPVLNKHLMASPRGTLRSRGNKTHCFPRGQPLSVLLYLPAQN